jgi:hypothetical protein
VDSVRYALKHTSAELMVAELERRFPTGRGKKGLPVRAGAIPASNEVLVTTRGGAGSAVLKFIQQYDAARGPTAP